MLVHTGDSNLQSEEKASVNDQKPSRWLAQARGLMSRLREFHDMTDRRLIVISCVHAD